MREFHHPAFFYRGHEEYLDGTIGFILDGLERDLPVAVAVPPSNLSLIRDALGRDADSITLLDMAEEGRNPGRIIPSVLCAFADRHPGRRVQIIGEPVWTGRTGTEYPACAQHEALTNPAFEGSDAAILCPYDAARLSPEAIADAEETHPVLQDARGVRPSARYDWEGIVAKYNTPMEAPAFGVAALKFTEDLPGVRTFTLEHTYRAGLGRDRAADAELAVNELASNSLRHGGGSGTLRIWPENGQVICEVTDAGRLTDPLTGRLPVADSTRGGRGVLLANLLADLVRTHSTPVSTTTRLYFRREV